MIFNPLFIDLEAKQINSLGNKTAKDSYLFRDIINLESNNAENRKFDTTFILSNLLTDVKNLSKPLNGESELNDVLAGFRISGTDLAKLRDQNSTTAFDAPILIESKDKIDEIIKKSIQGLDSEYVLQIVNNNKITLEGELKTNEPVDSKELIDKLKEIVDTKGQLNIHFYNDELQESFKLNIQKITNSATTSEQSSGKEDNPNYLVSISAKNFSYAKGNTPVVQRIIDANSKETEKVNTPAKASALNETTDKAAGKAEDRTKPQLFANLISKTSNQRTSNVKTIGNADTKVSNDIQSAKDLVNAGDAKQQSNKSNDNTAVKNLNVDNPIKAETKAENLSTEIKGEAKVGFEKVNPAAGKTNTESIGGNSDKIVGDKISSSSNKEPVNSHELKVNQPQAKTAGGIELQASKLKDKNIRNSVLREEPAKKSLANEKLKVTSSIADKSEKVIDTKNEAPTISEKDRKFEAAKSTTQLEDTEKIRRGNERLVADLKLRKTGFDSIKLDKFQTAVHKLANKAIDSEAAFENSKVGESTIKIKLSQKPQESYEDLRANLLKNYVDGSQKAADSSKAKYSSLLETLKPGSSNSTKIEHAEKLVNNTQSAAVNEKPVNKVELKPVNHDQTSSSINTNRESAQFKSQSDQTPSDSKDHQNNKASTIKFTDGDIKPKEVNANEKVAFENLVKRETAEKGDTKLNIKPEAQKTEEYLKTGQTDSEKVKAADQKHETIQSDSKETVKATAHESKADSTTHSNQAVNFGKEAKPNNIVEQQHTVKVNPKEPQQPQLNTKITDEISDMVLSGKKDKAIINLEPATLGKVKVLIELVDNKLTARLDVESQQAKEMLQNQMTHLKESLNSSGIQLSSLNISHQNADQKGTRTEKERRSREDNVESAKTKKEESNNNNSKNYGYNTYEYIA